MTTTTSKPSPTSLPTPPPCPTWCRGHRTTWEGHNVIGGFEAFRRCQTRPLKVRTIDGPPFSLFLERVTYLNTAYDQQVVVSSPVVRFDDESVTLEEARRWVAALQELSRMAAAGN